MTTPRSRLASVSFDANDPLRLARFWAATLGWRDPDATGEGIGVVPTDGTPFGLSFLPVPGAKEGKSRVHLDLVSESTDHRAEMVDRLLALGATPADIGQGDVPWTVLADPEGNEFCVVVRGDFLATTGLLGSIVFEPAGHLTVGRFWSEATGWPIVYEEDGDIAIRDPSGRGPFVTFGPPATEPMTSRNRLHLDIAPVDGDQDAEVARLVALGATRIALEAGDASRVAMADPEGNEFSVLRPPER